MNELNDKLYICILDEFPDYMAPTLASHATLWHHLKFQDDERYQNWLENSFRKCVVRVNRKEFDKIRQLDNVCESYELHTLGGEVSCLTIVSNNKEHKVLQFAKLWKPLENN